MGRRGVKVCASLLREGTSSPRNEANITGKGRSAEVGRGQQGLSECQHSAGSSRSPSAIPTPLGHASLQYSSL